MKGSIESMNILAIETTGPYASAALINENREIHEELSDRTLSHLQNLIPMIDLLLKKCQLKIDDVTHIAVSEGPGSFTGIRIGMATAKALAQARNIPAVAVPTLTAFAFSVPGYGGLVCPLLDARRDQVYAGAYYWEHGRCFQSVLDGAYSIDAFLSAVEESDPDHRREIRFFGDGICRYERVLEDWAKSVKRLSSKDDISQLLAKADIRLQKASSIALAALEIVKQGGQTEASLLRPVYLRKAEAERKLEQSRAGGRIK